MSTQERPDDLVEVPDDLIAVPEAPKTRVTAVQAAGRGFGGAGAVTANALQLLIGGTLATVADKVSNWRTGREDSFYKDAMFGAHEDVAQQRVEAFQDAPTEDRSFGGKLAGAVGGMPGGLVNAFTGLSGVDKAEQVVKRGGGLSEAARAGAVESAVDIGSNLIPMGVGKIAGKTLAAPVKGTVLGALAAAGVNVPVDMAGREVKNLALPEGEQYADLKQPGWQDLEAAALSTAMSAPMGAHGVRSAQKGALRKQASADAAKPPPMPTDVLSPLADGEHFRAPNGAIITEADWASSTPARRVAWMEGAPQPEKIPVAEVKEIPNEPLADTAEIDRLRAEHASPEVAKVLDTVAKEREATAVRRAQARQLREAALSTEDADIRDALVRRADKLAPPEKIPVGELVEGFPSDMDAPPVKPLPVGKVIEGAPDLPVSGVKKPLPLGEVKEGWPGADEVPTKPLPVGEAKELAASGVELAEPKVSVGEVKELYVDPARATGGEALDLALPTIDEGFMRAQERVQARAQVANEPPPTDKGRRHVNSMLDKMAQDPVHKDATDVLRWALSRNPNLARGLRVELGGGREGARGAYNNAQRVVKVFDNADTKTAVHEFGHSVEQLMPPEVQRGIRREWRKALEAEKAAGGEKVRAALAHVEGMLKGDTAATEALKAAFKTRDLDRAKHYQLSDPSEFWAENWGRVLGDRAKAGRGSWKDKARRFMEDLVEHAKHTLGKRSDHSTIQALKALLDPKKTSGAQAKAAEKMLVHDEMLVARGKKTESLDLAPPPPGPRKKLVLPAETTQETGARHFFDSLQRMSTAQELGGITGDKADMRLAARLMIGKVQNRVHKIEAEHITPIAKLMGKPMKKLKLSVEDADDYVAAHHALERNPEIAKINPEMPDGGSGLTNKQAKDMLAKFTPEQTAHLEKVAQAVYKMNDAKREGMVRDGLITRESADAMAAKYKRYVPLKTLEKEGEFLGMGRGYQMYANDVRAALGRMSKAGSPVAASIMDATHAIARGERAQIGKAVLAFARDPKGRDLVSVYDPENPPAAVMKNDTGPDGQVKKVVSHVKLDAMTVPLVVDGVPVRVFVPDPLLKEAIATAGAPEQVHAMLRAVGNGTRVFARTLTEWNPAFAPVNQVKDAITASIRAKRLGIDATAFLPHKIVKAQADVVAALMGRDTPGAKDFNAMVDAGGKTGAYGLVDLRETMAHLERLGADVGYADMKRGPGRLARDALKVVGDGLSKWNEVFEYSTRLAAFRAAKTKGMTDARAAEVARRITVDFNQSGSVGRFWGNFVPFVNASMQGLAGDIHDLKSPKTRARILSLVVAGGAAELFNTLYGGENEETGDKNIESQSDSTLDNNLVVLSPGERSGVKIPLPPGVASGLFALGRRTAKLILSDQEGRDYESAAAGLLSAAVASVSPVKFAQGENVVTNALQGLTPALVRPLRDVESNQNHFGTPIVPEGYDKKAPAPAYTLSRRTTSEAAVAMSKLLNDLSGGDAVTPGRSQKYLGDFVAPEAIEHIVGYYGGGVAQTGLQARNIVRNAAEGKPQEINKIPVARRFAFTEPQSYTSRRFKELQEQFEYARKYDKAYETDKVKPEILAALGEYKAADKALSKLFKEISQLKMAHTPEADAEVERVHAEIKRVQSIVIKAYNEAKNERAK